MSERDNLIDHLGTLSNSQLADGLIALERTHDTQVAALNEDNDALWDKVHDQDVKILAVQVIHAEGFNGRCRTCNKQRHPGPCETSIALGMTDE